MTHRAKEYSAEGIAMNRLYHRFCLSILILGLALAGCGPKYEMATRYVPPDDQSGKACIKEAKLFKIKC